MAGPSIFDPARDGFGFPNPAGEIPGPGKWGLRQKLDTFLYESGLCFGMSALVLDNYKGCEGMGDSLAAEPLSPGLIRSLQKYHARQLWWRMLLAAVLDWVRSGGGAPEHALRRLRLPDGDPDPHILSFGPRLNRKFLEHLSRSHAVVPYRAERAGEQLRVYVYDPNSPGDAGRFITFHKQEPGRYTQFNYDGFDSNEGWGITFIPLSVVSSINTGRFKG